MPVLFIPFQCFKKKFAPRLYPSPVKLTRTEYRVQSLANIMSANSLQDSYFPCLRVYLDFNNIRSKGVCWRNISFSCLEIDKIDSGIIAPTSNNGFALLSHIMLGIPDQGIDLPPLSMIAF